MSQFFTSSGQSLGVSASASVFSMNIWDSFLLGWTGWISLLFKGLSRVFSNTTVQKPSVLWCSAFFIVQLSHSYVTTGKTRASTRWTFVGKVMSNFFSLNLLLGITASKSLLLIKLRKEYHVTDHFLYLSVFYPYFYFLPATLLGI